MKFLKKGKAAHQMIEKEEAAQAAKQAANESKVRRYWMPPDKDNQITFLDGNLDDEGLLETVSFWEHNLKLNGHWRNWFPCTQLEETCPICEGGENPALVSVFTVIDHSSFKDKNGKTIKDQKRLFVCKKDTFRKLQKIAAKRGGLAGCTFDVSRTGDKSSNVGDTFDFTEKRSIAAIRKAYNLSEEDVTPYDYEEVIIYRNAKELRKLGFGSSDGVIGAADGDAVEADGESAYADEV